jgi:molybdopterin synthase catalytic subunit/molybdopterin synthase sulfur carrier subunit
MQVTVRVSGVLAQGMGMARFPVRLPDLSTAQTLLQHLRATYPHLSAEMERAVIVIGGAHQADSAMLQDGQEVALLMPIAGG